MGRKGRASGSAPEFDWEELHSATPGTAPSGSAKRNSFRHAAVKVAPSTTLEGTRGRGIALSGADGQDGVREGALIFACTAFALAPKAKLHGVVSEKLQTCSKYEADVFFCLYDGSNGNDVDCERLNVEQPPSDSRPASAPARTVDAKRVEHILRYNTRAMDTLNSHGAADIADTHGVWLLPGFLNHSCRPNVNETYVADMMVCRAVQTLAAGCELRTSYVSLLQPLHVRRKRLKDDFDFTCNCGRCILEEAFLSEPTANRFVDQLGAIIDKIDPGDLQTAANAFESLKKDVQQEISRAFSSASKRLGDDATLQRACREIWGPDVVPTSRDLQKRIELLLCSSFLPAFKGAAFAWKQLNNHSRATSAYSVCLDLLEEVAPGSAYHAHWAAECALQAHAANHEKADLERRVRYAQRWNVVCHGKEVFRFLMKRQGWPDALLAMTVDLSSDEISKPADHCGAIDSSSVLAPTPSLAVDFNVVEGSSGLSVSIVLPTGATPADLDLDVAPLRVVVRCTCEGVTPEPVQITLPRAVDPALAPPAKFKKKEHRVLLELPFA